MSLFTITFSESSDSSDDITPQLSFQSNREKSQNVLCRRPIPCCKQVKSVIHTIKIGSERSNFEYNLNSSNSNSNPNPSQKTNSLSNQSPTKDTFIYKNGRRFISPKGSSLSPNQNSINQFRKINPRIKQINLNIDDESESYYSQYSYYQYDSEPQQINESGNISMDDSNVNNLPIINSQINQSSQSNIQDSTSKIDSSSELHSKELINSTHSVNNNIIEKNSNLEQQKISKTQSKELTKYIIDRKKNGISIKGKSLKFTLKACKINDSNENNERAFTPFIEALVKGSNVSFVNSNTNEIIGSMKAKEKFSRFVIHKGGPYGQVIMEICYKSFDNVKPRKSYIKIYDQIFSQNDNNSNSDTQFDIINNMLKSRSPKRGSFGMWSLDFGNRKIISSIKNSIIVDKNNIEYLIIGKIAENSLSVEAVNGMDPICVLGIAISSFLYPKP